MPPTSPPPAATAVAAQAESFGVVIADNYGLFVTWTLIIVGILSIALSIPTVEREGLPAGEYYALMLFSLGGMILMAMATDLLAGIIPVGIDVITSYLPFFKSGQLVPLAVTSAARSPQAAIMTMSTSANRLVNWCNTVLPAPKGPGMQYVPPREIGRASCRERVSSPV